MPFIAAAADSERQADVAKRGADVMPFSLKATTRIFTKTPDVGTQRVIAKDASTARYRWSCRKIAESAMDSTA
jgi:hypothetical protein